jgi:hypothetical protein
VNLLPAIRQVMVACILMLKKVSSQFNRVYFLPSLVRRTIKRLKTKTKGGPDGIPPIFFINCCDELSYPLSLFLKIVLTTVHILPDVWLE